MAREPGPDQLAGCAMMGAVTDESLAHDIDAICRLSGEFTLRSGQVSSEYFDKYLFEAQPELLAGSPRRWSTSSPTAPSCSAASSSAASRSPRCVSARTGVPALFVRKEAKEYGTCKLAEGPDVAGRRVTLVEDVITTGGAVRDATRALRDAGAVVDTVICAIDRSPAGDNPLADVGLEVRPVLTKAELDAARG